MNRGYYLVFKSTLVSKKISVMSKHQHEACHRGTTAALHWKNILALGSSHYIVWSTSSDKGVFCLVGGKKIKIKIYILTLVGGKNEKKVRKWLFIVKINKFSWNLCSFGKKLLWFLGMSEEEIKKDWNLTFFSSSGIMSPRRRTSSTKHYSESCLSLLDPCCRDPALSSHDLIIVYDLQLLMRLFDSLYDQGACYKEYREHDLITKSEIAHFRPVNEPSCYTSVDDDFIWEG